jgi:hypothetical protein
LRKNLSQATIRSAIAAILLVTLLPSVASAAQITGRSVLLSTSSPAASAATTTYSFAFTVPTTGTPIKSVSLTACTTAIGACVTPTGFLNSTSTLASQPTGLGAAAGWTVDTTTAGSLRLIDAANATNPSGSQAIVFGNVQNPTTATGVSFYIRVATFSVVTYSGALDTGTVGASTANLIVVNADVAESLTFSTGLSGGSCAAVAASGSTVTLSANPLSSGSTSTGVAAVCASTNASSGYTVQYAATQFTNGLTNLTLGSNSTSTAGTEMFGFNIPAASVVGPGTATSSNAAYNTAAQYTFLGSGAYSSLITVAGPTNYNVATLNFVGNISNTSKPGHYVTTMTFVCTGLF